MKSFVHDVANALAESFSDEVGVPAALLFDYPRSRAVIEALDTLLSVILPGRECKEGERPDELSEYLARKIDHAATLLLPEIERALPHRFESTEGLDIAQASQSIVEEFVSKLPEIRTFAIEDVKAAYAGDPAALNHIEIKLSYPGFLAICAHRIAHELYLLDVPVIPRIMSETTHSRTGVDIHPGARIGKGFFIDHATGVVIGETATIGDNVKFYQGVTLGAKSFPLDENGQPIKRIQRHPTVEDDVVIYAHATILGGDTVIGARSTIGGNVFLMRSVPPDSFVRYRKADIEISNKAE